LAAVTTVPPPFDRLRARVIVPLALLLALAIALVAELHPVLSAFTTSTIGSVFIVYAALFLVLRGLAGPAGLDWDRLLGPTLPNTEWRLAAVAFALAAISYGGVWLLWLPVSFVAPDVVRSYVLENAPDLLSSGNGARMAFEAVVIAVVAPAIEEVLFRGILLHRWSLRWGVRGGVILSSAVFAVLHVEIIGHFIFAVVMAALYIRTRSLWVPIAAHALNNTFALALALPDALDPASDPATLEEFRREWPTGALALLVGVGGIALLWRHFAPRGAWSLPYSPPPVASGLGMSSMAWAPQPPVAGDAPRRDAWRDERPSGDDQ
jgi:membrane protease YdiL (CAAX protease family)